MKSLDEKKLLAKMARGFGQPDLQLEESIRIEEELNERLFKKPEQPKWAPGTTFLNRIPEQVEKPAETNIVPKEQELIKQTVAAISSPKFTKSALPDLQQKEIDGLRRQISEIIQKMGTLAWGSGGTGVVKIHDTDDFDKTSYGEGRYLKWSQGMFRLDEINPFEVVHNTTLVNSSTYTVVDSDYYIGVNYNGLVDITLPNDPAAGRTVVIKDESGLAQFHPIHIVGTIDNDAGGATIKINNGAVQLLYRNGWRIV